MTSPGYRKLSFDVPSEKAIRLTSQVGYGFKSKVFTVFVDIMNDILDTDVGDMLRSYVASRAGIQPNQMLAVLAAYMVQELRNRDELETELAYTILQQYFDPETEEEEE